MAITISGENNNDRILASDGVIDSLSGFNVVGVITATSFTGDLTGDVTGNLTGNVTGNINNSTLLLQTGGSERIRITGNNEIGIAGANYGTSGQVLTSGGSGSAVSWTTIAAQANISNNADNRVITGGSGVNLNGEANLTFNGNTLSVTGTTNLYGNGGASAVWGNTGYTGHLTYDGSNNAVIRAASGKALIFQTDHVNERLRIDSNGRLVMGHTSALGKFHGPYGTTNRNPQIQVNGTNISNASLSITSWDNNVVGYYGAGIFLARSGSSTIGTNSRVTNQNTILGSIIFSGDDGTDFVKGAMIQGAVDNAGGAQTGNNDMPGRLMFLTTEDGAQEPTERLRIHSNGDISIGDNHTSATRRVDILNGSDEDNIVIIRGADATTEYAAIGVNGGNAIITGGSSGSNNVAIHFRTTISGTEAVRLQLSDGGVLHVGGEAVSNTIPSGGLDLQGNQTNCVLEMGNPFPNYSGGMTPEFRITTVDASHTVEFRSVWGGTNGLYKHMSFSGGATMFYDGVNTQNEVVRITGSGLTVGTTSLSDGANTDEGVVLNENGQVMCRRNSTMFTAKSIATGGYTAFRVLSAQTQVGSISFNSGGTSFNTSSDYRRKENVIDLTGAITRLKTLKPKRFNFISNPSITLDGFLAHEVTAVPEAVTGTKDEVATEDGDGYAKGDPIYQQLDQSKLVPLLTAALQEAIVEIETLKTKVDALEGS